MRDSDRRLEWRSQLEPQTAFFSSGLAVDAVVDAYLILSPSGCLPMPAAQILQRLLALCCRERDSGWLFGWSRTLTLGFAGSVSLSPSGCWCAPSPEESAEQLRSVFDNASDIVILNDGPDSCGSIMPARRCFGYSSILILVIARWGVMCIEQDLPRLRGLFAAKCAVPRCRPAPRGERHRRDGGEITIEIRACPVKLGKWPAMIVRSDITDRAVYEDNLRKSAYYRALFDETRR